MVSGPLIPQSLFGFEGIAVKELGFAQGWDGEAPAFEVALFVGLKGHHKSAQGKATNGSVALGWMNQLKSSPVRAAQWN